MPPTDRRPCDIVSGVTENAPELHPTTWRMLRALRAGVRLSRNRHYALFEDAHVRRAIELHRFLRSIAADVRRHAGALTVQTLEPGDAQRGEYAVRLDIRRLHGTRTAYLTDFELALLAEDAPEVAEILGRRPAEAVDAKV